MELALNRIVLSQCPPYHLFKTSQRDREVVPCLSIVHQDLPLHALCVEYFEQAGRSLLETELRKPQGLLGLLQQSFIEHINQLRRGADILVVLMDGSPQFIARPEQLGLLATLGA